ncbi:MAG: hypothetical protein KatS3mg004_1361 [Bryobacteraceae bacterium]|nr:MAG: hypothetical protein KatS3mg004_1361 [Bryobacteraceae bacterium]
MAPPVADPAPEEAGVSEEGENRRRESSGQCRWCGQPLPLLARLRGARFCSDWHERQYRRQQSEQFLERVKKYRRVGGGSRLRSESAKVIIRPSPSNRGKEETRPTGEGATRSALPETWRDAALLWAAFPSVAAPLACGEPASRPALRSVPAPVRTGGDRVGSSEKWVQAEEVAQAFPASGRASVPTGLRRNAFMLSIRGKIPGLTLTGQVSPLSSCWMSSVLWVPPRLPGLSGTKSGQVSTAWWRAVVPVATHHPVRAEDAVPPGAAAGRWFGKVPGEDLRSPMARSRRWTSRPLLTLFVHLLQPLRALTGPLASGPVRTATAWQDRPVLAEAAGVRPSWVKLAFVAPLAACTPAVRRGSVHVVSAARPVVGSGQTTGSRWLPGCVSRPALALMTEAGPEPVLPDAIISFCGDPAGPVGSEWPCQGKHVWDLRPAYASAVSRSAAQASRAGLSVQAGGWLWSANPWQVRLAPLAGPVLTGGTMSWETHVLLPCSVPRAGAAAGSAVPERRLREEEVWRTGVQAEQVTELARPEDAILAAWWKRKQGQGLRLPERGGLKVPVFHGSCETAVIMVRPEAGDRWIPEPALATAGPSIACGRDLGWRIPRVLTIARHRPGLAGWVGKALHGLWAVEPASAVAVGPVPEFGSLHGVIGEHAPVSPRIPPRQSDGSVAGRPQRLRLPALYCRFPEAAFQKTGLGSQVDEARLFRAGPDETPEHR